ncbi:MAG: polyprenyl diphosphate synthase [Proteobacteria bacterium]|nr:polyprenyl diphosphate synthase [Pseudomonadota bacterium]
MSPHSSSRQTNLAVTGSGGEASQLQHLAIIMDGNRRWARERGMSSSSGHEAGARTLEDLLPHIEKTGITVVTVYAFSQDNWQRPKREISALFSLCRRTLLRLEQKCIEHRLRVEVIGRRDRLPDNLNRAINRVTHSTSKGSKVLRIALDYSSRYSLIEAISQLKDRGEDITNERVSILLATMNNPDSPAYPDVDLVIRTGREQRLSDFLLWESAYAELYFAPLYWPDFNAEHLNEILEWFHSRARRYGG